VTYLLIPLIILAVIAVLFGTVVFLGRFRNGRYLRPIITTLSKVPWLRRQFEKASQAAMEKQNPELASAMRKLQRAGPNPDPQRAQQVFSQLTPAERRAYLDAMEQQGQMPEPANRQMRRQQQKLQQANRPSGGGSSSGGGGSGGSSSKRGKRR
jgi:uncharacterized membrane protein YgcG